MKRSLSLASIAAVLFLAPVLISAQNQDAPANRPNPQGQPGRLGRGMAGQGPRNAMPPRRDIKADLGLTDVQQADMRKVRETAQRDRLRKSTDLKIARLDLRSLLRADKPDEKAVALKLAEVQAAQGALLKIRVDSALAMKRILTPEQQKKIGEMRAQRGSGRMNRRMGERMKMRGANREGRGRMGQQRGMRDDAGLDLDDDDDDDADAVRPGTPRVR
jgi:Spy/CpxP family protein refolding chaperone